MDLLEEKIAQITNPDEFAKLCNALFTDMFSLDYQVIDGTRSDEGNDGYVKSQKRIFAIYCPKKPERKTDNDYKDKIKSDMLKASRLKEKGIFGIDIWTFVTPRKLSNHVIECMYSEAKKYGLEASQVDATFIANNIYQRKHILSGFSQLKTIDLQSQMGRIEGKLDAVLQGKAMKQEGEVIISEPPEEAKEKDKDFFRIEEIIKGRIPPEQRAELRSIYYKTINDLVKINALLALVQSPDPLKDDDAEIIGLCDSGVELSKKLGNKSVEAIFLARKGYYLSKMASDEDMIIAYRVKMAKQIGVFMWTAEEYQNNIKRIRLRKEESQEAFNDALELSRSIKDYRVFATVLMNIGQAAGQKYIYLNKLSAKEFSDDAKATCTKAYMQAKEIYAELKDDLNIAYVLFNYANWLRFFGEKQEALKLLDDVDNTSQKYKDDKLSENSKVLRERIVSGRIPDYIHGGEISV